MWLQQYPFNTLVKISFILLFTLPEQIVLVTSVVPHLYWPPESTNKISFFYFSICFIIRLIMNTSSNAPEPAIVSKLGYK